MKVNAYRTSLILNLKKWQTSWTTSISSSLRAGYMSTKLATRILQNFLKLRRWICASLPWPKIMAWSTSNFRESYCATVISLGLPVLGLLFSTKSIIAPSVFSSSLAIPHI